MEGGAVAVKSFAFAIRIIKASRYLMEKKKEFILSKQLMRSGTAVGALIKEGEHAQSRLDFLNKMNIALKEANETDYWLMLLKETNYIAEKEFNSIHTDCTELIKLLASIVKTTKKSLNK
jgi:four helix bundle protein